MCYSLYSVVDIYYILTQLRYHTICSVCLIFSVFSEGLAHAERLMQLLTYQHSDTLTVSTVLSPIEQISAMSLNTSTGDVNSFFRLLESQILNPQSFPQHVTKSIENRRFWDIIDLAFLLFEASARTLTDDPLMSQFLVHVSSGSPKSPKLSTLDDADSSVNKSQSIFVCHSIHSVVLVSSLFIKYHLHDCSSSLTIPPENSVQSKCEIATTKMIKDWFDRVHRIWSTIREIPIMKYVPNGCSLEHHHADGDVNEWISVSIQLWEFLEAFVSYFLPINDPLR